MKEGKEEGKERGKKTRALRCIEGGSEEGGNEGLGSSRREKQEVEK